LRRSRAATGSAAAAPLGRWPAPGRCTLRTSRRRGVPCAGPPGL